MKIILLLSIIFSISIQSNCGEEIRAIMQENSTYRFNELVAEGGKYSRSLFIRGSNRSVNGKKLASLEYEFTDDKKIIDIGLSFTNPEMRSLGLQTILFRELISRHPEVKRFNSLLVSTNEEVILRNIIEKLIRQDIKINQFRPSDKVEKQFESCCGDYFRSLSTDEQKEYILEGLKSTPIFKVRTKLGLKLCREEPYDFQTSSYRGEFSITLYVSFCL